MIYKIKQRTKKQINVQIVQYSKHTIHIKLVFYCSFLQQEVQLLCYMGVGMHVVATFLINVNCMG